MILHVSSQPAFFVWGGVGFVAFLWKRLVASNFEKRISASEKNTVSFSTRHRFSRCAAPLLANVALPRKLLCRAVYHFGYWRDRHQSGKCKNEPVFPHGSDLGYQRDRRRDRASAPVNWKLWKGFGYQRDRRSWRRGDRATGPVNSTVGKVWVISAIAAADAAAIALMNLWIWHRATVLAISAIAAAEAAATASLSLRIWSMAKVLDTSTIFQIATFSFQIVNLSFPNSYFSFSFSFLNRYFSVYFSFPNSCFSFPDSYFSFPNSYFSFPNSYFSFPNSYF